VLLLPGASEALVGGKTGKMYLVNTANPGGEQANDAGATHWLWCEQDLSTAYSASCTDNKGNVLTTNITSYQIYGTGAFFNGSVYLGVTPSVTPAPGPVRQFTYAGGKLTPGEHCARQLRNHACRFGQRKRERNCVGARSRPAASGPGQRFGDLRDLARLRCRRSNHRTVQQRAEMRRMPLD
jgi:hypothetical protein